MTISMSDKEIQVLTYSVVVAMVLNVILSYAASYFATEEEKFTSDPRSLGFFSQIIHMLHHHNWLRLSSSVLVSVVVLLSIIISHYAIQNM